MARGDIIGASKAPSTSKAGGASPSRTLRVLVIEENPYHLELLTALLARELPQAEIDTHEKKKNYHLIFCDTLSKIAPLQKAFPQTPIIVLDSFSDEAKASQAIKLGAEEYLAKNRSALEKLPHLLKEWGLKTPKKPLKTS